MNHALLITTFALSLSLPAYAMEEPTLKQQIEHARSEIAATTTLADERLKEEGLSADTKVAIENKKLELAILDLQLTVIDRFNMIVEAMEKQTIKEIEEASKVRINGSTQVTMDDDKEDEFVVVSDPKPADLISNDKN